MNDILSTIGLGDDLGTVPAITGTTYDLVDAGNSTPASASSSSGGLWNSLSNFGSGLLQFGSQALPVATQVNNLVNSTQGKTAQNNTSGATGIFGASSGNSLLLIGGAVVGVVLLVLLLGRGK